jgi:hypothetical protein
MKVVLGLLLLAGVPAAAQETNAAAEMMQSLGGGLSGERLRAAIDKAAASPLGSRENPVRADIPQGERAYLARLRCTDGSRPGFQRVGSMGSGPFGYIVDGYAVSCPGAAPVAVHMDMYHRHVETAAVPGFTIVPVAGADPITPAPAPAPTSKAPTI